MFHEERPEERPDAILIWIQAFQGIFDVPNDLFDLIESDPQTRWTLATLAMNTMDSPLVAPARTAALSHLRELLCADVQLILQQTTPSILRYPDVWEIVFANVSILDHAALRWLITILSPTIHILGLPTLLSQRLGEQLTELATSWTVELLTSFADVEDTRTQLFSMLFSPYWDISKGATKYFFHAYDKELQPVDLAVQRWPNQLIQASIEILNSLTTLDGLAFYENSLERLLGQVARCGADTSAVSTALYALVLRFVGLGQLTDAVGRIIRNGHCHFERSGCLSFSHELDTELREMYHAEPEHPGKRLIEELDDRLGHALQLHTPPRFKEGAFGLPNWMMKRHSAGIQRIEEQQRAIDSAIAKEILNKLAAKSKVVPPPPPNFFFGFGPRLLRRFYYHVLSSYAGFSQNAPPPPATTEETFRYYAYHLAVECHSTLPIDLKAPGLKRWTTDVLKDVEFDAHEPTWASLTVASQNGKGSTASLVRVSITETIWCFGVMRKRTFRLIGARKTFDVTIAIPKAMGKHFSRGLPVHILEVSK